MGIIIVSLVLVASGWMIISTTRKLAGARNKKLWAIGITLTVLGIVMGCILSVQEYQAGTTMRVVGIPMPLGFFHFENGQWLDFPLPAYVLWPAYFANVIFWMAICLLPLRLCASATKPKP
jgi:hypothetical protein